MHYEFRFPGRVPGALAEAFPELTRVFVPRQTVFFGPVTDEAHLYGLLARFRNLGLHVEEMRPVPE